MSDHQNQETFLFEENQQFRHPLVRLLVLIPALILLYGAYQQLYLGVPFGDEPASDRTLLGLTLIFGILLPAFFFSIKLTTRVRPDGIYVRFFPIHLKFTKIRFSELRNYQSVRYNPLRDYGGWGIRYGSGGKAYNISGDQGISLEFVNGKKLLIGTQHPQEMLGAIITASGGQ